MDPSRDPVLRRQILSQQPMAFATSLPSGQAYYTLESLEGATSLPFLKPATPAFLPPRQSFPPPPPDRDALLRLDAQTRALLPDRENLDARARLLAAEREALLRNMPGGATALPVQRMYADGLQALDARTRVSLVGSPNLDPRARASLDNGRILPQVHDAHPGAPLSDNRGLSHGFVDTRPRDPLQLGFVNISRALPVIPGTTEHGPRSELLRGRELGAGPPFLPAADPTLGRRDIGRAEVPDAGAQSASGSREPAAMDPLSVEVNKAKMLAELNSCLSISKIAGKVKPPKGWCAECKIDCHSIKNLRVHVNGKRHKAVVGQLQGNTAQMEEASSKPEVIAVPSTSQADKKRASDENPETSQIAKRVKASTPVAASNAPVADLKEDEPTATKVLSNPSHQFCELCNVSGTENMSLEAHFKGKRHAARVKQVAKRWSKAQSRLAKFTTP